MPDDTADATSEETAPVAAPDTSPPQDPASVPDETTTPVPESAASQDVPVSEPVQEQPPVEAENPTPPAADPYPNLKHITPETARLLREKSKAAVAARTAAHLETVMKMFNNPHHKTYAREGISNSDVQLELRVSHATAARALAALVKAGRLAKVGKGNATRYKKPL